MTNLGLSAGPRQRRFRRCTEVRSADLISAARDLFVEKGFAAARLEDVAAKAGVSKGTAYLYFESKETLFRAVVDSGLQRLIEVVERLAAPEADRPVIELLREYVVVWQCIAGEVAVRSSLKLLAAESGNFPDVASRFNDAVVHQARSAAVRIIAAGIAGGTFRPVEPDVVADFLLASMWLSATGPLSGQRPAPGPRFEALFDILAHGLLLHPQTQAKA